MWSCTVQFLRGKIARIQITPSTPLYKVLAQACQKFDYNPSEYILKHGRTTLDLSVPILYSNLPNKAHLEAVQRISSGKDSPPSVISIALQLPSSDRVEREHPNTATLMDVVSSGLPHLKDIGESLSIVYMRQSFVGFDVLQKTTLSDLGLSTGKAVLRIHVLGDQDETFSLMDKMDTSSQLSVSDGSKDHVVAPTMTVPDSLVNHPTTDSRTSQEDLVISSNEEFQREFAVYHKSSIQESHQEDLPNSFFDVTPSDVLLMQQHLTDSVKSLENSPLRTLSMRQCSIKAEEDKYKRAVIRTQFPDGWILEAIFEANDPLRAIVLFVREHLDNPNMKFHLYTSPPKSVLRGSKRTLEEAGLVPAAVIYFGTDDPPSDGFYLCKRSLSMESADVKMIKEMRDKVLSHSRQPAEARTDCSTRYHTSDHTEPVDSTYKLEEERPHLADHDSSTTKERKTPKWMKLGPNMK